MYGSGDGSWMHGNWMFGGGFDMILMWLVPIAVVIALVVYLTKRPGWDSAGKTTTDILKERYARGEIGKEEFSEKKRDIGG